MQLIAKIENHEGIENLEEIIRAADGIMIARGDLGMELLPEQTTIAQKMMTYLSRKHCKPVIVATQMLESMTQNARPTRAEIADISNAVLDGNDAVMLSGETSIGNFPSAAVKVMRNISQRVETCEEFDIEFKEKTFWTLNEKQALIQTGVEMAFQFNTEFIIVLSRDDLDARFTAALRPRAIILAPYHRAEILRFLELFYGLYGVMDYENDNHANSILKAYKHAVNMKFIKEGKPFRATVIDCDNLKVYPFSVNE